MPTTTSPASGVETAAFSDETEQPLHVIIAHDDHAAYVRALRMLANTFFGRPEAASLCPLPWRFDQLGTDPLRKQAIADAPRADVFVVSTSACSELPEGVALWLSDCFALRHNSPTAVIALCDTLNDIEVPWRRLLRDATTAAGLDFLEASVPALQTAS